MLQWVKSLSIACHVLFFQMKTSLENEIFPWKQKKKPKLTLSLENAIFFHFSSSFEGG